METRLEANAEEIAKVLEVLKRSDRSEPQWSKSR